MTPHSFMPGSSQRLGSVERRPGETLFDYLTRCRWEMGGRIRVLEMVRDTQETIFLDESSRWRRHMILLALGEAVFAGGGYILLDHIDLPAERAGPLVGGLIGVCALVGAWLSIRILAMRDIVSPYMLSTDSKARRLIRWLMPVTKASGDGHAEGIEQLKSVAMERWPAPDMLGVDNSEHLPIDPAIEDRIARYLEMEGFMWRLRLLFAETLVICLLTLAAQLILGTSFLAMIDAVALIATVCLIGGFLVLFLSNLVSTRAARLSRWWRGR